MSLEGARLSFQLCPDCGAILLHADSDAQRRWYCGNCDYQRFVDIPATAPKETGMGESKPDIVARLRRVESLTIGDLYYDAANEIERLRADGPGTPLGRIKGISDYAETLGYEPYSSEGPEAYLFRRFDELRARVAELKRG